MSVPAEAVFVNKLSKEDVTITEAAEKKLAELLAEAEEDLAGIRVYVSGGGCGGMQYGMTFTEAGTDFDVVYNGNGFDLFVDSVALGFLRGVEIDYVEKQMGGSFVFNNVFAATGGSGTCGACGARTGPGGGGCA